MIAKYLQDKMSGSDLMCVRILAFLHVTKGPPVLPQEDVLYGAAYLDLAL